MILGAYALSDNPQPLVVAPPNRDWMDATSHRHAYRCLPIAVANTYGWQLLLPDDVTAEWSGGVGRADVTVTCVRPYQAVSNFARGVLTFDVSYIFRTPKDFHLLVTGPSNTFKDGIAPMTAIIESDWLPYSFTFNYQFTRPGRVHWKAGEPYAQICVVPAGAQENVQPIIRRLADNSKLMDDHEAWRARRASLLAAIAAGDQAAVRRAVDRDYYIGRYADGTPAPAGHTIKCRLKAPIDERD
jgi:Family of unknown function (DUF6065)